MASNVASSIPGNLGRTAVVALTSTGLVLGGAAVAQASPSGQPDTIKAPSTKSTTLSAEQIERAGTQSTVTVDAGTDLGITAATVTAEAPPPPPPPPPVVRTVTTSRTRTATQATTRTTTNEDTATAAADSAEAETVSAAPAIDGSLASAVVAEAFKYIGTPYVSGGASPSGFDCSGFVQYVFAQVGVSLPRTSSAQAAAGYRVSASEARAGDLIYQPGHIGIYLGDGQHIAARSPGTPLKAGPVYMTSPQYIRVLG